MKTKLILGGTAAATAAGLWVGCVAGEDDKPVPTASEPVVEQSLKPEKSEKKQEQAPAEPTSPSRQQPETSATQASKQAPKQGGRGFNKWRMYAKTAEAQLKVEPLDCPGCKEAVRARLDNTPGIERVEFRDGRIVVTFDVRTIGPEDLGPRLRNSEYADFEAELDHAAPLEMLPKDERPPAEDMHDAPAPADDNPAEKPDELGDDTPESAPTHETRGEREN